MSEPQYSLFNGRPALVALLSLISGILFGRIINVSFFIPFILVITILFIITILYLKGLSRPAGWIAILVIIALGWFRAEVADGPFPPNHIENLAVMGGRAEIIGKVVSEPDQRADKTYLIIEIDSVVIKSLRTPSMGRLRAGINEYTNEFGYGDHLKLSGYLYKPSGPRNPGAFDYKMYLEAKEIFAALSVSSTNDINVINAQKSFLSVVISPLRKFLIDKTVRYLPESSAAILSGFILGERRNMPAEYERYFRDTGTMHLMAVSGSNVGVVIAFFALPLTLLRLPRPLKAIILAAVVIFFAILTRLEPSVIRASIMALVGIVAYGWMRKPDYVNLLGFAGLIMLLWMPLQLFDVGLQLSFAATFGILYATSPLFKKLSAIRILKIKYIFWAVAALITTLVAQAAVMPLMGHYFNNFTLVGIIANLPIGILASCSTILGMIFYLVSWCGYWPAFLISIPLKWILSLTAITLKFFASLPLANIKIPSSGWIMMISIWIVLYLIFELFIRHRLSRTALFAGLITLNIFIWEKLSEPIKDWRLEFLDLGRNHAWIFSGHDQPTMGCYDDYHSQGDAESMIPLIINNYSGKMDILISSTPDSKDTKEIASEFGARLILPDSIINNLDSLDVTYLNETNYGKYYTLSSNVKIVWPKSDNIIEGDKPHSYVQIDVSDGVLILAGWAGIGEFEGAEMNNRVKMLELSWSSYAQTACLDIIDKLKPEMVVFSPDRYSVRTPYSRNELTHSAGRTFSTSIFGAMEISNTDSTLRIGSMKNGEIEGESN